METTHRYFFRCLDCLAVMATPSNEISAVCSCGGDLDAMGAAHAKHTYTTTKSACDYRCTNAKGPECDCTCGSANHGSGAVVEVVRSESMRPQLQSPSAGRAMEFHLAQDAAISAFEAAYPGARAKFKSGSWLPRPTWDACRAFRDAFIAASDLKVHSTRIDRLTKLSDVYAAAPKPITYTASEDTMQHAVTKPAPATKQTSFDGFAEPEIGGAGSAIDTSREWSDQQRAIFDAFADPDGGHLVVEALAGTGKTTTIMEALKYSKLHDKVYCAFNKRNAEEAKQKIGIHGEAMTLNSLGYRYVRAQWPQAKPDDAVETDRIKAVLESRDFDDLRNDKGNHSDAPRPLIKKLVGLAKNSIPVTPAPADRMMDLALEHQLVPEKRAKELGWDVADVAKAAGMALELATKPDSKNRISFNDQVWLPVVMGWVRPRFDMVVVDECQDMSATQLKMAQGAVRADGRIVLVGDRRQAIYAFRGADSSGMARMQAELKAAVLPLTTTYRCPRSVVALAQKLVPAYNAAPSAPEGSVSDFYGYEGVVGQLVPGDAVVSRVNAPLMPMCLQTIRRGVRAHVEGRDVGAALADLVERLGPCSVGELLIRVQQWQSERVAALQGDEETIEKAAEVIVDTAATIVALTDGLSSSGAVADRIRDIFSDKGGRGDDVTFSSIHRAKGLEWNRVYVLVSTLKINLASTEESEEQNLGYVGFTRAKRDLVLVYKD